MPDNLAKLVPRIFFKGLKKILKLLESHELPGLFSLTASVYIQGQDHILRKYLEATPTNSRHAKTAVT